MGASKTVYLIDGEELARDALHFLFRSAGMKVEYFATADEFMDRSPPGYDSCIVLDIHPPYSYDWGRCRPILDQSSGQPVVVIAGSGEVESAVDAMKAGAFDFIERPFDNQVLLGSVRDALAADLASTSPEENRPSVRYRLETLTKREYEVLELVFDGEPNKRIAYTLGIHEKTVEFHRANLKKKMGAKSSADLIRMVATGSGPRGQP